jgi:hypothetical protein
MDHDYIEERIKSRYRRKIFNEIEPEIIIQAHVPHVGTGSEEQRVTVGRCSDDSLGSKIPTCTWSVLHNELLAQPLRKP